MIALFFLHYYLFFSCLRKRKLVTMTAINVYAVNTATYHATVENAWFIKLCGMETLGKNGKKVKISLNVPSANGKNIPENIAVA